MPMSTKSTTKQNKQSGGFPGTLNIWEFPKTRGTLFWVPYNKDPTIWDIIFGSPIFGNSHFNAPIFIEDVGSSCQEQGLCF